MKSVNGSKLKLVMFENNRKYLIVIKYEKEILENSYEIKSFMSVLVSHQASQ